MAKRAGGGPARSGPRVRGRRLVVAAHRHHRPVRPTRTGTTGWPSCGPAAARRPAHAYGDDGLRHCFGRRGPGSAHAYGMTDLSDDYPGAREPVSLVSDQVSAALGLVERAQEVLTRAVLYEQEKGTSWEKIAEQLGIRRQSAHERYQEPQRQWRESCLQPLDAPSVPGGRVYNLRLHAAAYTPTATGQRLDTWAHERGYGEHAVTAGLPTLSLLEEMNQVLEGLNHLYRHPYLPPDPAARLRLVERKAALLDRIAVEQDRPEAAGQAAEARAYATQLRAEIDGKQ